MRGYTGILGDLGICYDMQGFRGICGDMRGCFGEVVGGLGASRVIFVFSWVFSRKSWVLVSDWYLTGI